MITNEQYFIKAALDLNKIPDQYGYYTDDGFIKRGDQVWEIDVEVEQKAAYYANLARVRAMRDRLLADTDWVGGTDVPATDSVLALRSYRQALRDITDQVVEGQSLYVVWPADPRVGSANNFIQTS